MKRSFLLSLAAVILIGVTGCGHFARKPAPTTRGQLAVALAVTVNGTEQPTPSQWAVIVAAVRPQLEAAGYIFATNLATADRILRIDFTPNPLAPETSGRAVALGWRANPAMAIASTSYRSGPSSFSYVNYGMGYNHSFYDYYNDYTGTWTRSSGETPAPATPTPPSTTTPGRHGGRPGYAGKDDHTGKHDHTGKYDHARPPGDRPPGDGSRPPGRYAGRGDSTGSSGSSANTGSTNSGSSSRGSWWRGRSDSGGSDSGRSSSSSSYSSSSNSSSSYSSPSYSSTSDSGGSSSYSGGSSSSSSSSSSGGGGFDSSSAGSTQIER